MRKIKLSSAINFIIIISLISSIVIALLVRFSYSYNSEQYDDFLLISKCYEEELNRKLEKDNIKNLNDIYNGSTLVVIVKYNGEREVYKENASYNVEVTNVLKGTVSVGDQLRILEYSVFDADSKMISTLYGNVPFIKGNSYLLYLSEQEQHGQLAKKTYYITTESPLGKYMIGGETIIGDDDNYRKLSECININFIAENKQVQSLYNSFFKQAEQQLQKHMK